MTNLIGSMLMGVVFMIAMLLVMIMSGAVSLQRTDLVFSTESASAMYDGKPLTNHTWELASGELKAGHRAMVTFTGSQTAVGESDNSIQVKILDAANADVTGDYSISYNFGKLKVNPRMLTVKSEGGTKVYDGSPLMNPKYTVSELISGHTAVVLVTGAQTQIGYSANTISMVKIVDRTGADVTFNYQLTKIEEPLVVTDKNGGSGGQGSMSAGGVDFSGTSNMLPEEGLENTILYRVYANTTGTVYLKIKSYGDYTGTGFAEATRYTSLLNGRYAASYLTSFALQNNASATKSHIVIRTAESKAYALPYYMASTLYTGYEIQKNDVESTGSADEYRLDFYMYDATPHLSSSYNTYERNYRNFVYNNYLEIDAETLAYFKDIIEEGGFDAHSSDIIENVAAFIRGSAEYDIKYDRALDNESNIAIAFINDYKSGVCKHYAMAATMMYRALGIPARYTIGVMADAKENEWVDVTALSAHAWVEVYRDGIGWVQVEVTGGTAGGGN
ncbi:MAG: transglutaminase domain-containing protein, partial [Clostridia bacterium]|nr:transglutaminase domain-containing protein [Clostridia bacterium]